MENKTVTDWNVGLNTVGCLVRNSHQYLRLCVVLAFSLKGFRLRRMFVGGSVCFSTCQLARQSASQPVFI